MVQATDALDPAAHLSAMVVAAGVLEAHAGALDALDGLPADASEETAAPVPGSAAGSDLATTLAAAVEAARDATSFAAIAAAMESGSGAGATGAAGRALSTFLGGMGEVLSNTDRLDSTRLALALEAGAERLAPRDDGRHPGGFVPVASAVADAALVAADRGSSLGDTVLAAADAGIEELERGPVLDAELAERGTVDPAAAGFLLMLDALASVITGEPPPEPPGADPRGPSTGEAPDGVVAYELGCRLEPYDPGVEARAELEAELHALCRTMELLATDGAWVVEVTTTRPGAVVEILAGAGSMGEVRIGLSDDVAAPLVDGSLATDRG